MNRKDLEARMILPKGWKYITVLDFEVAKVFQYELPALNDHNEVDGGYILVNYYEDYITNKGHNLSNCEWMVHDSNEIITN
jgi:hypothetical protein